MEIRFYHLQRSTIDQALPSLLERAYAQGMRSVVVVGSEARAQGLDALLWTYRPDSFLPHGLSADDHVDMQHIVLVTTIENPNGAKVLFLTDGGSLDAADDAFTLCCDLFDGNDETALAAARQRWKSLKDTVHTLTYWQQTEAGWEKKV